MIPIIAIIFVVSVLGVCAIAACLINDESIFETHYHNPHANDEYQIPEDDYFDFADYEIIEEVDDDNND